MRPDVGAEFAATFSAAVQSRNLTLDRISARLRAAGVPVSVATLSYWQTGRSRPTRARSMRAVAELELILRCEPGTLTNALPVEPVGLRWDPTTAVDAADTARAIIADLNVDSSHRWARLSIHDQMHIGPDRTETSQLTREIRRAERDGLRTWAHVVQQDSADDVSPEIEAVSGCFVGQIVQVPEQRLTVVEMVLPRALSRGQMVMTEMMTVWGQTTTPSYRIERSIPFQLPELLLDVSFDCDLPSKLEHYVHGESAEQVDDRAIILGQAAQAITLNAPPGVHGMRWEW